MPERPDILPGWIFAIRTAGNRSPVFWECLEVRDDEGIFLFKEKSSAHAHEGTILRQGTTFETFQRALDAGRLRRVHSGGKGHREGRVDLEDLPPESFDIAAAFRKEVCEAFDRDQRRPDRGHLRRKYSKSDKKLADLARDVLAKHPEWNTTDLPMSGGAVRRWINNRGIPGRRRAEEMICRTGKTRRARRKSDIWHSHRETIVLWYWSLATRSPEDAKAHLDTLQDRLDAFRRHLDPEAMPVERVSITSIYERIAETTNFDTWSSKYGVKAARERFAGSISVRRPEKFLDVVELDHTWADQHASGFTDHVPRNMDGKEIFVVDLDRMIVLGRPWVSVARDLKTTMTLGHTIFYRNPSIFTMCELLRNTIRSNEWMKDKYSFFDTVPEGHGRPSVLCMDNDWAHTGISMKNACEDMGIELHWCPIHCPTAKPGIERGIGTIKRGFFHKAPGGVPLPPEQMRRLGLDPTKDAAMNIEQVEAALVHFLYKDLPLRHSNALGMAPLQAWRNQTAQYSIPVVDDVDFLDAALGTVCRDLTLDRNGVIYKGLRFHDPEATEGLLRDLIDTRHKRDQRKAGSWSAKVTGKINEATISRISLFNPKKGIYIQLPNVDKSFPVGLDFETYTYLREVATQNNRRFGTEEERLKVRDEGRRKLESGNPALRTAARQKQHRLKQSLNSPAQALNSDMVLVRPMDLSNGADRVGQVPVTTVRDRSDLTSRRKDPVRGKVSRAKKEKLLEAARRSAREAAERPNEDRLRPEAFNDPHTFLEGLGPDWKDQPAEGADMEEARPQTFNQDRLEHHSIFVSPDEDVVAPPNTKGRSRRPSKPSQRQSAPQSNGRDFEGVDDTTSVDPCDPREFLARLGSSFGF